MSTDIVIVAAARTAVGKFGGTLAKTPASELGAAVIAELLSARAAPATRSARSILGQVLHRRHRPEPGAPGGHQVAACRKAVPAMTINKVCGSGLKAVMLAAQAIRDGDSEIIIAGGQESMSMAPHVLPGSRDGQRMGDWKLVDYDDRRRPVGRVQPVPHGHHRRERGQEIRRHARAARRAGAGVAAEGRRGTGCRPLQGRDRAVQHRAEERRPDRLRGRRVHQPQDHAPKCWPACVRPSTRPAA